jgi:hypothetical protein
LKTNKNDNYYKPAANGTIEVPSTRKVPEPNNTFALTGIGIIGAILLRRRRKTAYYLSTATTKFQQLLNFT